MNISLSAPDTGEREMDYVNRVLQSKQLSMGPWIEQFEKQFAAYSGTRYAIAVNSGTSALHLCVRAMEIGANDEVITTSFSFVASVNCFVYEGALPALVDIDPATLNLDPKAVREFLRTRCKRSPEGAVIDRETGRVVKALLPVHVFGLPCAMDELMEIAREYRLLVLEDACEAIGAEFHGQRAGTFGKAGVFAFYPNKQMTTGEGGMITTDDARIAESCRSMRNQGRDTDGAWLRHVRLGYNYRLSELHAALGLAQLERIDSLLAARSERSRAWVFGVALRPAPVATARGPIRHEAKLVRLCRQVSWRFVRGAARPGPCRAARKRHRVASLFHPHTFTTSRFSSNVALDPASLTSLHGSSVADQCLALPFHSRLSKTEIKFVCDAVAAALEPLSQHGAVSAGKPVRVIATPAMGT